MPASLRLVVATYTLRADAEAAGRRLTHEGIPFDILVRSPGPVGRLFGRHDRFQLGVAPSDLERARGILTNPARL